MKQVIKKEKKEKEKKDIIKINGEKFKKEAFIIEEHHPAIGRILIVDDVKFKILDDAPTSFPGHRSGTFIKKMTEEDETDMEEYDEAVEELSEKLIDRVDLKRMIKENIKQKPIQDIKTGLFILKEMEAGKKVEEEHHKGCYNYKLHHGNQTFELISGSDVQHILE